MRFTKDHEWLEMEGDVATVGVTAYAAEQLGDVVFVELPEPGATLKAGAEMAVVESVKAASDVYAPVSGEVVGSNGGIANNPQGLNDAPEGSGWLVKIRVANPAEIEGLMDRDAYEAYLRSL